MIFGSRALLALLGIVLLAQPPQMAKVRRIYATRDAPVFVSNLATGPKQLASTLGRGQCVVLIGAGVRLDPKHFLLFERLINATDQHAPGTKICFNTGPTDTSGSRTPGLK